MLSVSRKLLEVKVEASSKGGSAEPGYPHLSQGENVAAQRVFSGDGCWSLLRQDTYRHSAPRAHTWTSLKDGEIPSLSSSHLEVKALHFQVCTVCLCLVVSGRRVGPVPTSAPCLQVGVLLLVLECLPPDTRTAAPAAFPLAVCLCVSIHWCFASLCLRIENLGSCGPCEAVS